MKKVLPWLKANWLLVVLGVLVLAAIPTSWYFSSSWRASMLSRQEKIAADEVAKLQKAKVNYTVASPIPGIPSITANQEANSKMTEFMAAQKAKFDTEAKGVIDLASTHNAGPADAPRHKPLLDDLFPFPKNNDLNRQIVAFQKELVGPPGRPSAYQRLLTSINAGSPPDRHKIGQDLSERAVREVETIKGTQTTRQLTSAEIDEIVEKLLKQRVGAYQALASQISVYAGMDSLPSEWNKVLRQLPADPYSLEQCFSWQADYWLISDIFGAIKNANTPPGASAPMTVDRAPVKRILYMDFDAYIKLRGENDNPYSQAQPAKAGAAPASVDGVSAMIQPRFSESVTGRWGGKENKLYEVRYCHIDLIVASARIPEVLNAISSSNFMTVVDLDMKDVKVWDHLQDGYYYGNDHVVQLGIEIEVVWLKSWIAPMVPQGARDMLGFPPLEGAPAPAAPGPAKDPAGGPGGGPPKGPRRDR